MSIQLPSRPIWLAGHAVDFRKSIDGLLAEVATNLDKRPQDDIVIFYNKRRNRLKILLWDDNGYALIYKRIEQDKFVLPKVIDQQTYLLDSNELAWLMQGIDWLKPRQTITPNYQHFC